MDYNRIISVTGLGGLYELLSSKSDGAIVKSMEDNTTKFVSSRVHNFSHLESIEVYTQRENVNLVDVFKAMQESKEALPSDKDPKAITAYFKKVYPEMDFERVYASDMKKMVRWFKILQDKNVEIKLSEMEEDTSEAEEAETVVTEQPAEEKPKKKAAKKKTENNETTEATAEAEKPKKKAAKKKTTE